MNTKARAAEHALKAMKLMEGHGVSPIPQNFELWYTYASGSNLELNKAIDGLVADGVIFKGDEQAALYKQYLEEDRAALKEAGVLMHTQLTSLLHAVGLAHTEIDSHHETIRDNLSNFEADTTAVGLELFVQKMMAEARAIQETNAHLMQKLEKSSNEVKTLQENLLRAEQENYKDGLTGIANRKKFDAVLGTISDEAAGSGEPLCLAVCDIDNFKKFNDSYGHQVGDQVLKLVAGALHANVKGNDLAARYGGEEFALLLPATKLEHAFALVDKIRGVIAARVIRNPKKDIDYGFVTMSVGVAEYKPGEALSDFVERADRALYSAKKAGRNRTLTEHEISS